VEWELGDKDIEATNHVQVFIPQLDRNGEPIPLGQEYWVGTCLELLGKLFGGATAFPPGRGVWRDYDNGRLVFEETAIVFSYVPTSSFTDQAADELRAFLHELGRIGQQGEVGILIDGTYVGIRTFGDEKEGEDAKEPRD
jgi:hypothetical protein